MTKTMSKAKYLLAFLAAAVLAAALSSVAWADDEATKNDSITINSAKAGETYSIYKLFDLSVDNEDNPSAYSYKVNENWEGFFAANGDGAKYVTINNAGYVTELNDANGNSTEEPADLAKAAANWASKPAALNTVEADGDTVTFANLVDGYYLVTSSLGTVAMTQTTPAANAVTINEKNPEDTIEKKVKEDSTNQYGNSNDAQIGDIVEFRSTAQVQPHTRNVYIHDTMSEGLTFTTGSLAIYTNEELTNVFNAQYYTILGTPSEGDTFTIQVNDGYVDALSAAQTLYIVYTATLNESAINVVNSGEGDEEETSFSIVDQKNTTKITYGDKQSVQSETTTTTHKFSVYKHAGDSAVNLAGAVFALKKGDSDAAISLMKLDDNNYRIANENEPGAVNSFTTVANGDIVIWGVDADNDYKLTETQAPAGYNAIEGNIDVTVNADNATRQDVENNTGSVLPSTGGMGTTILYIVGGILVAVALVVLITKRRVNKGHNPDEL